MLIARLRNLVLALRMLSTLDPEARRALRAVASYVSEENIQARRFSGIDSSAVISPVASLRFAERVRIGAKATLNPYSCVWGGWSRAWARIGPGALIGTGAVVVAGRHAIHSELALRDTGFEEADVTVGAGAGISANAIVIGCRVGENAIVGPSSVVTRDVPDGAIAVGMPARVVGYRSPPPD